MNSPLRNFIFRWFIGVVVGTAIIAVSSPLFIRSYLPLQVDPVRGVWTLQSDSIYRWRSEGYADTQIGPLGMPGKKSLAELPAGARRVALWGDSQAEGVAVEDHAKIFAQSQTIGAGSLEVFPFARSGEDVSDWLVQIPRVDKELDIDVHVILVVDLDDLSSAHQQIDQPLATEATKDAKSAYAAWLPAFVIQGARHLLTESGGSQRRQLRFSIGPTTKPANKKQNDGLLTDSISVPSSWPDLLRLLSTVTSRPVVLLYAPKVPMIAKGKVNLEDPLADEFAAMRLAAEAMGIKVVDVCEDLRQSAQNGKWSHGFHNGAFGSGHLNATGNRIVAAKLVEAVAEARTDSQEPTHTKQGN